MRARLRLLVLLVAATLLGPFAGAAAAADRPGTIAGARTTSSMGPWLSDAISSPADVDVFRFRTGSAGRHLVTLGGLPANYQMSLYDSAGRRLLTSNRPGRQFEEMYPSLAAGTYFVRVSGVSGSSSPTAYALRWRPLSPRVTIVSARSRISSGYLSIAGEILNNTARPTTYVKATATYYDSAGRVVGTDFTYTEHDIVNAHTRSPFVVLTPVPAGYHHFRVAVASVSASAANAPSGLRLRPGVPSTEYGYRSYPGEVYNATRYTARFVKVMVTEYNRFGGVLDTDYAYTSPETVGALRTAPFEVLKEAVPGVNRVGWSLDFDR